MKPAGARASASRCARQSGISLISMLVGMAISLIVITSMLVFYKTIIDVSNNASQAAVRNGQVSAALLAAQMDLQSAGFGVPASTAPTALASNLALLQDNKEIVWRSKADPTADDTHIQCSGLLIVDPVNPPSATQSPAPGLYRLPPQSPCTDVASATWVAGEARLIAGSAAFFVPKQRNGKDFTDEQGGMSLATRDEHGYVFALRGTKLCLPYMQQDFATAPMSPSPQVALVQADKPSNTLFSVCLSNLAGESVPAGT